MERPSATSEQPIIHGPMWTEPSGAGRPKTRLFGFLSLAWLGVFLPAACRLSWTVAGDPDVPAWVTWVCGAILVPEPMFVVGAVVLWFWEKPRK